MLNNLRIKNFRMLEDLEIPKLGRVNLIVGKNNSGKSTILEALRIYAGNADLNLLREILISHDELFNLGDDSNLENELQISHGLKHFFSSRQFPNNDDTAIAIISDDHNLIKIEHIFYYDKEEPVHDDGNLINVTRRRIYVSKLAVSSIEDAYELIPAIRISFESGSPKIIPLATISPNVKTVGWRNMSKCSFVPTEFLTSERLSSLWDQITLGPNEEYVLKALKIIDTEIEKLNFVEDVNRYSEGKSRRLAIVKLKNVVNPVPLSSMGEGMSRILQLILYVFPAKDGFLLIDEFELGLHYSVQEQVWRIIFELAKELNIQVFATTHSWDCIESFTKVAVESPEEAVLLKISKSARTSFNGRSIVTIYDEESLKTVTATNLEVR